MVEYGERVSLQDQKLNALVKKGIFQPFSAITNPFHDEKPAYLNPFLTYTNPQFDFGNGLPTRLPYMIALGELKQHPDTLLYCRPNNRRTGIVTSSSGIFSGHTPLDYLDEKGSGQLFEEFSDSSPVRRERVRAYAPSAGKSHGKPVTWGLTDIDWALHDATSSEDLARDGVRVVPTVAVVGIKKIFDDTGRYIWRDEAIHRGLLADNTAPAIQFRAYVTPYRPNELLFTKAHKLSDRELQRRRIVFLQAMDDMSKDRSIPVNFTGQERSIPAYLDWFAETFGYSLARLHKVRKVHHWLHELHNITLDVRIIDSDGLEINASDDHIYNEKGSLFSQYRDSPSELWKYYDSIRILFDLSLRPDDLLTRTIRSYDKEI